MDEVEKAIVAAITDETFKRSIRDAGRRIYGADLDQARLEITELENKRNAYFDALWAVYALLTTIKAPGNKIQRAMAMIQAQIPALIASDD